MTGSFLFFFSLGYGAAWLRLLARPSVVRWRLPSR
jgi:arginine exporter protein ArgO